MLEKDQDQDHEGVPLKGQQQTPHTRIQPTTDWLESAERDYAFGGYEFFGQEWGEKLIEEVRASRRYREQLKHLASLCGMASSRLCALVAEKDIAFAKDCCETGIWVMRQLVEEDRAAHLPDKKEGK